VLVGGARGSSTWASTGTSPAPSSAMP
jgi:hypothetical protein